MRFALLRMKRLFGMFVFIIVRFVLLAKISIPFQLAKQERKIGSLKKEIGNRGSYKFVYDALYSFPLLSLLLQRKTIKNIYYGF